MKKQIIIIGIILMIVLPIVSAQLVFKLDQQADLKIACTINGAFCSPNSRCNITTSYPNGTVLTNNQQMGNQVSYHNYTYSAVQLDVIGDYANIMNCQDGVFNGTSTFDFKITPSGTEFSTAQGLIYTVSLIIGVLLFTLCLYGAIRIPYSNKINANGLISDINYYKHFKSMLFFACYLILIFIFFMSWMITDNFLYMGILVSFFSYVYAFLIAFFFPVFVLFCFFVFVSVWQDAKLKKLIDRNLGWGR